MLSWLRCFPHDGVETNANAGRRPSLRRKNSAGSSSRRHHRRIIRTSTTVSARTSFGDVGVGAPGPYNHNVLSARSFTYRELAAATASFSLDNLIGEGGFGLVYRGQLPTGEAVAVKRLDRTGLQGDREFLVEVLVLSGVLTHPNLVGLLGYCADGNQRLLVYRLIPLGSLEDHLFQIERRDGERPPPLPWRARMRIAYGAAQGLEYLHETANPPVIYRDLKSSNILLDEGYEARLSDFGLARIVPTACDSDGDGEGDGDGDGNGKENRLDTSSRVMGTYGYCAPEYVRRGHLTVKSDVYSFGVLLLELITGRRVIDGDRPEGQQNLVQWAAPMFGEQKRYHELVDPLLFREEAGGPPSSRELKQAVAVATMCLQEEDTVRPVMSDVVLTLSFLAVDADADDRDQR